MRKIFLFAAIAASMVAGAANSFNLGSDTIRIHPNRLNGYSEQVVYMTTDAYCDSWNIQMGYPQGVSVKLVAGITPLSGMTVDYADPLGKWGTYEATLNVSAAYGNISSTTSALYGYWDYNQDNIWEPYGTVKWEPGTRQMFSLNLYLAPEFRSGWLTMDATINSAPDSRGPILSNVRAYKRTYLWVGYMPGDATGDGILTVGDATLIISYLLLDEDERSTYWGNEWSAAAADYDRDGYVSMADVGGIIRSALVQHIS